MIEANEKSTTGSGTGAVEVCEGVWLDPRLALFHEKSRWLAIADVHYGYEVARRATGGLWPMWGMGTIEERFGSLLEEYEPETVILAGDVVDGGLANREAIRWLDGVRDRCRELFLIAGNHDRGPIRRELVFTDCLEVGGYFFHHGHEQPAIPEGATEITGHWHPSVSLNDGAGLRLRLPSLVQEKSAIRGGRERWILPAFSPWAGGGAWKSGTDVECRQWACGNGRIIKFS